VGDKSPDAWVQGMGWKIRDGGIVADVKRYDGDGWLRLMHARACEL
jgi:hypothetical protein